MHKLLSGVNSVIHSVSLKVLSSSTPAYLNDMIQSVVPVRPLRSSDAPLLSAARTRTEFARRAFSVAAPHTWNSLPSDIRSCHTVHAFKNTLKHTCSDNLNLKPPAPPHPLQDFQALYKYCIIIIIIIIIIPTVYFRVTSICAGRPSGACSQLGVFIYTPAEHRNKMKLCASLWPKSL